MLSVLQELCLLVHNKKLDVLLIMPQSTACLFDKLRCRGSYTRISVSAERQDRLHQAGLSYRSGTCNVFMAA